MLDYLTPRQGGVYTCSTRWSESPSVATWFSDTTPMLNQLGSYIRSFASNRTTRRRLRCRFIVPLR